MDLRALLKLGSSDFLRIPGCCDFVPVTWRQVKRRLNGSCSTPFSPQAASPILPALRRQCKPASSFLRTGSLLLPFVYSATISPDAQTWHKLDALLNAMLTNEISRKASVAQGSALMRVAASVFTELPCVKIMRSDALSGGGGAFSFHHAPVFGLVCGLLGFDAEMTQRAFMFVTMREVISAATGLNLVGPMGAAVLQHEISPIAEDLSRKWMSREVKEACQTCPLIDTVQGCQGYLFSRLFCS